jgi:hypothetical protein
MKKMKFFGMIALVSLISFAFMACPTGNDGGSVEEGAESTITITNVAGIPSGNYYIYGEAYHENNTDILIFAKSISTTSSSIGTVKVNTGNITLNVFDANTGEKFTGNAAYNYDNIEFYIYDFADTISPSNYFDRTKLYFYNKTLTFSGSGAAVSIDFSDFVEQ